jgi:hypothetical protein
MSSSYPNNILKLHIAFTLKRQAVKLEDEGTMFLLKVANCLPNSTAFLSRRPWSLSVYLQYYQFLNGMSKKSAFLVCIVLQMK